VVNSGYIVLRQTLALESLPVDFRQELRCLWWIIPLNFISDFLPERALDDQKRLLA